MKRLLLIAVLAGAALLVGVAPATARPLSGDDDAQASNKRKKSDGGTRDEEDLRRDPPAPHAP